MLAKTPEAIRVTPEEIAIGAATKEIEIPARMEADRGGGYPTKYLQQFTDLTFRHRGFSRRV